MRSPEYETIADEGRIYSDSDSEHDAVHATERSYWSCLWNGPAKPENPHISTWWDKVQKWPYRATKNQKKPVKYMFTLFPLLIWALSYIILTSHSLMAKPSVDGKTAVFLRCTSQLPIWHGNNAKCGIDGIDCLRGIPFGKEFRFKCPANCYKESWTYKPISAGNKVAYHEPFLVGSNNLYRVDSFICAAALHRGIISNTHGGCGVVRLREPRGSYLGEKGNNSIVSFLFDTEFPASYSFDDLDGIELRGCDDKRNAMMLISALSVVAIGYLSVDSHLFVFSMTIIGFCTVILASNPPLNGGSDEQNAEIVSLGARRLLPTLFSMVPIYKFSLKRALSGCEANLSRAIFWCIPFYLGVAENYTFGMIPIDRITTEDLNGQAGAWTALIIIMCVVLVIILGQAYVIWRAGMFKPFMASYSSILIGLVLLSTIPSQTLRIHHYILAVIFLPGTGFQTTPSWVYNGLLTGLFLAGVARWDFDSILQTYDQLRRGGPEQNTGVAAFTEPLVNSTNFIVQWGSFMEHTKWNGYSLLINDVERYRGNGTEFDITMWSLANRFTPQIAYIRLALADMYSKKTGVFTMAGMVNITSGTWVPPEDGMT